MLKAGLYDDLLTLHLREAIADFRAERIESLMLIHGLSAYKQDRDCMISDQISKLLHLAHAEGLNFTQTWKTALQHFLAKAEDRKAAWHNSAARFHSPNKKTNEYCIFIRKFLNLHLMDKAFSMSH